VKGNALAPDPAFGAVQREADPAKWLAPFAGKPPFLRNARPHHAFGVVVVLREVSSMPRFRLRHAPESVRTRLRRERNGPRSCKRRGKRGEDAEVAMERDPLKPSHSERCANPPSFLSRPKDSKLSGLR
jgi:hypothetical protein